MGVDSDKTTATIAGQMKQQRAKLMRPDPTFRTPPEDAPVAAQRALNDRRGREIKRRNRGGL